MERIPTVGVVLIDKNKVLLVEHGKSAGHHTGSLGTPGGRIDGGESEIQAAIREVLEETGLKINQEDLVEIPHKYKADLPRKNGEILRVLHTLFTSNKYTGKLRTSDEAVPKWIHLEDLGKYQLMTNTEDMIERAISTLKRVKVKDR